MSDTIRSRTDLVALLANNTTGDISPQDLRDFLVTALGGYGGVYTTASSTSPVACVANTERTLPTFDNAMPVSGVVTDTVNGTLTVPIAGDYLSNLSLNLSCDVNNTDIEIKGAINGVATPFIVSRSFPTANSGGSVSLLGLVAHAANDVLSIRIETNKTCNVQVISGGFITKIFG